MNLVFSEQGLEDYLYWFENDKRLLKRINNLIKECKRSVSEGTGKPEPLKYALSGCWSRRINEEHRLVYKADDDNLFILQCRYHY